MRSLSFGLVEFLVPVFYNRLYYDQHGCMEQYIRCQALFGVKLFNLAFVRKKYMDIAGGYTNEEI